MPLGYRERQPFAERPHVLDLLVQDPDADLLGNHVEVVPYRVRRSHRMNLVELVVGECEPDRVTLQPERPGLDPRRPVHHAVPVIEAQDHAVGGTVEVRPVDLDRAVGTSLLLAGEHRAIRIDPERWTGAVSPSAQLHARPGFGHRELIDSRHGPNELHVRPFERRAGRQPREEHVARGLDEIVALEVDQLVGSQRPDRVAVVYRADEVHHGRCIVLDRAVRFHRCATALPDHPPADVRGVGVAGRALAKPRWRRGSGVPDQVAASVRGERERVDGCRQRIDPRCRRGGRRPAWIGLLGFGLCPGERQQRTRRHDAAPNPCPGHRPAPRG